jgi:peptide/nickel transport system substrate-binding protein
MKRNILSATSAIAMLMLSGALASATAQEKVLQISSGGTDIATLDAHRASATTDKALVGWMYNGLVRFPTGSADPKDLEPDLAERWETSADRKTWTFYLRKGVKFHDNWGELTADDVVYSLKRAADAKHSTFAANFAGIDSVEKVDDHTMRVTLKYPDANFLGII